MEDNVRFATFMVHKIGIIQEVLHELVSASSARRAARQLRYEISLDSEHLQQGRPYSSPYI